MKVKALILALFFTIMLSSMTFAFEVDEIETFQDFNRKIPELNEYLQETPVLLPPVVIHLINNKDIAIHVSTNSNYIQSFVVDIYENYIIKVTSGPQSTQLYVEIDEDTINELIADPQLAIEYYKDGTIQIKSTNSIEKFKLNIFRKLTKWFA